MDGQTGSWHFKGHFPLAFELTRSAFCFVNLSYYKHFGWLGLFLRLLLNKNGSSSAEAVAVFAEVAMSWGTFSCITTWLRSYTTFRFQTRMFPCSHSIPFRVVSGLVEMFVFRFQQNLYILIMSLIDISDLILVQNVCVSHRLLLI